MSRYAPTRAGIVNLWDYRDEEFVFADGWLVLRGPNGSGKTKALEVLFPFVLDGRIEPRRLNPFASEERTMKSNLLYRGQESALSYVWLEFGDGTGFVTVGVGLRAQRHHDKVTRWYFVTDGRVGVDFSLLDDEDRPLVRKHLAAQLGADAVRDNAEEHRAAVDARLFGLGRERYEQLLNLVLTLRKPQLAKHLDPVSLSDTLADGLRPLDEDLLAEAARSFDDMEAVQKTLDGLVAADEAARGFLAIYTTYLRTHARAAADKLTARRQTTDQCRQALTGAEAAHRVALQDQRHAGDALAAAELEPPRLRAHLDALKLSDAYQSLSQLENLERLVGQLSKMVGQAQEAFDRQRRLTESRTRELATAVQQLNDREAELSRSVTALAQEAELAGIDWQPTDGAADDLIIRVAGRVTARREDLMAVREAASRLAQAKAERQRAAAARDRANDDARQAADAEQHAAHAVEQARSQAAQMLAAWAAAHADMLSTLEIASIPADLAQALSALGEPDAPSLQAVFATACGPAVQNLRDTLARLRSQLSALAAEVERVERERAEIAAQRDDAPAPWPGRPAERDARPGAPLWRLVRFDDAVSATDAARLEAALEAANLLDAWVCPGEGEPLHEDGYLRALPAAKRPKGKTLAEVLVVEEQDLVPAKEVSAILASIALGEVSDVQAGPPLVDPAGRYTMGVLIGALTKPAAEYIGATARARRRELRLHDCDRKLTELAAHRGELERSAAATQSTLDGVAEAERGLPVAAPILTALRAHQHKAAVLQTKTDHADEAGAQHDAAVAAVNAAEDGLRRTAAQRSLAAERVDEVAGAVSRFERCGDQAVAARRACAVASQGHDAAQQRLDEAADVAEQAEQALAAQRQKHEVEAEQVRTLRAAIADPQAKAILADIAATTSAIEDAEQELTRVRESDVKAQKAVAASERDADNGRRELETAIGEELAEAALLGPYAHDDLLELLKCPPHLRWPAQPVPGSQELPAEVVALHEAILTATKDLTPTETSLKQTATRLHRALDELHTQLSAAGQDYRPEHDTDGAVLVIRVADDDGYAPIKVFADRLRRHREDQELLLTEAERRIFEDTLLASLARQIHQRTIDARDLVEAMDHEMRKRRMSSGVTVGVGWQLSDGLDEEQRMVCKLLDKTPARLSPGDLVTMRKHFADRIKTARVTRGDRSYRELLGDVLDYRRWRVFAFKLHRPGGVAEPLTKARHSQLSGGEQSVSLHLPLFAAAHALFTSANAGCPRLLALDEAFAGVDDNGRAELMALAVQFDLHLFMTGYDLWATHASVPACAHYDLSHSPAEHLVSGILMVWDGAEVLKDFDGTLAAALGSPGRRSSGYSNAEGTPSDLLSEVDDALEAMA